MVHGLVIIVCKITFVRGIQRHGRPRELSNILIGKQNFKTYIVFRTTLIKSIIHIKGTNVHHRIRFNSLAEWSRNLQGLRISAMQTVPIWYW